MCILSYTFNNLSIIFVNNRGLKLLPCLTSLGKTFHNIIALILLFEDVSVIKETNKGGGEARS